MNAGVVQIRVALFLVLIGKKCPFISPPDAAFTF